jgi:hypothetical protein
MKRKKIPNGNTLLLSLAAVDLQNGKGNSREVGGHIYRPSVDAKSAPYAKHTASRTS